MIGSDTDGLSTQQCHSRCPEEKEVVGFQSGRLTVVSGIRHHHIDIWSTLQRGCLPPGSTASLPKKLSIPLKVSQASRRKTMTFGPSKAGLHCRGQREPGMRAEGGRMSKCRGDDGSWRERRDDLDSCVHSLLLGTVTQSPTIPKKYEEC